MNTALLMFFLSLIVSIILTKIILVLFSKYSFGQKIRNDGPSSHLQKSGTPTCGGISIMLSVIITPLLIGGYGFFSKKILCFLLITMFCGLIGFFDDYLKITQNTTKGLIARYKIILEILAALFCAFLIFSLFNIRTNIYLPYYSKKVNLGMLFFPYSMIVFLSCLNSVNLTDGLDGLACSVVIFPFLLFSYFALKVNETKILYLSFALLGALLGFLWFNTYPAKIFMGDSGALFLGAFLGSLSLVSGYSILLLISGGVLLAETLSVVIQVVSFKFFGRRVFKMSPLHHHFELCGSKEPNIVFKFSMISLFLTIIAFWIIYK